ncbi:hypothetical protein T440DRAFT_315075 [Plenodomus tracheiphilus IPT5]|uniref:Uncharacterized protein n=1 Tax=Plenodomus tracheiphilus IPT5 TaxID=1408161 RepID=A0A6A7ANF1_9PLEO|nr:hypothetical protein T440DRAFT_315075 [Plenodomus tracheiphilus IPT5]
MEPYHHDSFAPLDPSFYHEPPGFLNSGTTNLEQMSPIGNRNAIAPPSGDLPGNDPQKSNTGDPIQEVVGLLKQTVPMQITAQRLLEDMTKAQEELKRKQEELKKGQEEVKRGLDQVKKGQDQLKNMMTEILHTGRRLGPRSDHSLRPRSRLEYTSHNEPALPDQPRTIILRYAGRYFVDSEPSAIPINISVTISVTKLLLVAVVGYCTALHHVVWSFRREFL